MYNKIHVVKKEKSLTSSRLKNEFYKVIEHLKDTRKTNIIGVDTYSSYLLLKRTINKRPLHRCKVQFDNKKIFLILDDSGSMEWWAKLLNSISNLAQKRKEIKRIWAPNFFIENDDFKTIIENKNSIIIFVGDFDGGNTVYYLTKNKFKTIWLCPENRYKDTLEHSWNSYSLEQHKKNGVLFYRTINLERLLNSFKKILKKQYY